MEKSLKKEALLSLKPKEDSSVSSLKDSPKPNENKERYDIHQYFEKENLFKKLNLYIIIIFSQKTK
jgi:hypothetical protein